MNEQWLYLLPDGQWEQGAHWPTLHGMTGQAALTHADLASAGQALQGTAVRVVLAQELLAWHRSPAVRKRLGRQALGYAMEEQLCAPLETLHLAFGECDNAHRRAVQSIDRHLFERLLGLLAAHGIDALSVHVDADLLPGDEAGAWWIAGRWLLGGGLAPRLALSGADAQVLVAELAHLQWHPDSQPYLLAAQLPDAIDLRQGAFRRRRTYWPWAGLALGVLAFAVLGVGLEHHYHVAEQQVNAARLAAQQQALAVPAAPAPTRVQQLAPLAEHLVASAGLYFEQARWQVREGWRVQVLAADFVALERLRERQPDLALDDASSTDDGVRARLNWPVGKGLLPAAQASFSPARLKADAEQAGVRVEGLQLRQGQAVFTARAQAPVLLDWLHRLELAGGRFQAMELERVEQQLTVRATLEVAH